MSDPTNDPVPNPLTSPDDRVTQEGFAGHETARVGLGATLRALLGASRGYWLVNLVNFGDGIAYFGFLTLFTLYLQHDLGFTTTSAGLWVSAFTGLVTLFMAAGAGALSDVLGSRRALTTAIVFVLVGRILITVAPSAGAQQWMWTLAWVSLVVMAFGEGVIQPALYAGVKEYTDDRTATLGYAFLYSIMNLGIVAGEFVSPLIRGAWASRVEGVDVAKVPTAGITGAYLFYIGITALMLVANLLLFTRKVEERERRSTPEATRTEAPSWRVRLRSLPLGDARFLFFILVLLPVRTLFAHQWLTMPDYVTRVFPSEVGARWEWLSGVNPLVIVVFVPLFAALTRHRRVVDMMIVGTWVSAVSTFMLLPEPNLLLLIGYMIVFSLGEALWSSRFLEYIADLAPANRVGIYMGIAGLPWFIAKSTTGLYSGVMLNRFIPVDGPQDPSTLWIIYGAIAMISPIGLLLARRWLLEGERAGRARAA